MKTTMSRAETVLAAVLLLVLAGALFGPALAQPHAHGFADARTLWGIPHALDVLSNLPFALAGLAGLWALGRAGAAAPPPRRLLAGLFFVGLVVIAFGSSYYHLAPDNAGLAIDRHAMAIAFAGIIGLAASDRVSDRAGLALGIALLLLAPVAVQVAWKAGNVLPWALVQFGGMLALVAFALLPARRDALPVNWWLVLAAYALAKAAEMQDHAIYSLTGEWFSGHSLKHVLAALAAIPVITPFRAARGAVQNGAQFRRSPA